MVDAATPERHAAWWRQIQTQIGREYPRVHAWDAVNEPMIRHWCEALGDQLPIYCRSVAADCASIVAPPGMLRSWLLPGFAGNRPPGSAQEDATVVRQLFADGGYPSLIGVGTDEEYLRYLSPGDRLAYSSALESVSELKRTRLGEGYFFTVRLSVFDQRDAAVGVIRSNEFAYRPTSLQSDP